MRKFVFTTIAGVAGLALSAGTAMAGNQNMAGCGLGSLVFQDNDKVSQILAATTNGTFGSQTFGITTGTLNCTPGGTAAVEKDAVMFAQTNMNDLSRDMAAGQGEYVAAFASTLGCRADVQDEFAGHVQSHFETIAAGGTDGLQLVRSVKASAASNPTLTEGCSAI